MTVLAVLTVLAIAWTYRALYLDYARQRRRADRLAARCADMREELDELHSILDGSEPAQPWTNVRIIGGHQ